MRCYKVLFLYTIEPAVSIACIIINNNIINRILMITIIKQTELCRNNLIAFSLIKIIFECFIKLFSQQNVKSGVLRDLIIRTRWFCSIFDTAHHTRVPPRYRNVIWQCVVFGALGGVVVTVWEYKTVFPTKCEVMGSITPSHQKPHTAK